MTRHANYIFIIISNSYFIIIQEKYNTLKRLIYYILTWKPTKAEKAMDNFFLTTVILFLKHFNESCECNGTFSIPFHLPFQ